MTKIIEIGKPFEYALRNVGVSFDYVMGHGRQHFDAPSLAANGKLVEFTSMYRVGNAAIDVVVITYQDGEWDALIPTSRKQHVRDETATRIESAIRKARGHEDVRYEIIGRPKYR